LREKGWHQTLVNIQVVELYEVAELNEFMEIWRH
jgi:hypothetical protein